MLFFFSLKLLSQSFLFLMLSLLWGQKACVGKVRRVGGGYCGFYSGMTYLVSAVPLYNPGGDEAFTMFMVRYLSGASTRLPPVDDLAWLISW